MTERQTRNSDRRIDAPHSVRRPCGDAEGRHAGAEASVRAGRTIETRNDSPPPPVEVEAGHHDGQPRAAAFATKPEAGEPLLAVSLTDQLDRQAAQLADALDQRAQQLDHREAQLNARAAELEQALRTARLWAQERERELHDRQTELDTRQQRIVEREQALAQEAERFERQAAELRQRHTDLEHLSEQLTRREAACQSSMAKLEKQRQEWRDALHRERQKLDVRRTASLQLVRMLMHGIERRRAAVERWAARVAANPRAHAPTAEPNGPLEIEERLQDWECRLGQQEAQLATALEQLAYEREQFQAQREVFARQRDDWWERQRAKQRKMRSADRQRRQQLRRRREQLDHREAALLRLRDDLARTHRQTLELRLVTEELWARLVETAPPPQLIRSLAEVRQRLNDQLRFATDLLVEKQRDLQGLREQLDATVHDFQQQQQMLQQWFVRRQDELREQAMQIDAQRRQLAEQQNRLEQDRRAWQQDRTRLEAELLRLRSQHRLSHVVGPGAVAG